jgi:hypothetical protein
MCDLDAELRRSDPAAVVDDARQRRLAVVVVEADVAVRDAAAPLHRRRFHHEQPGARVRQHAEVGHVPVARAAVVGAVLAHRRDDDPVGELDLGQSDRREQRACH